MTFVTDGILAAVTDGILAGVTNGILAGQARSQDCMEGGSIRGSGVSPGGGRGGGAPRGGAGAEPPRSENFRYFY